jgi:5-methylcytosine-specific restriction endonuclease McrA
MSQDLHQAIADLLDATKKTDLTMKQLSTEVKSIEQKYDPVTLARQRFNNWRSSDEGKKWKQNQFAAIASKCPYPRCLHTSTDISSFAIDHIKPLSKYPELAVTLSNLRLLCHSCNLRKGSG